MKPVRLAALAQDDLRDARDWYEARDPGLGQRFLRSVDSVLAEIPENPRRYQSVHSDIRRAFVRPFPYGIYFREMPGFIRVIAVIHLHRHPKSWEQRR